MCNKMPKLKAFLIIIALAFFRRPLVNAQIDPNNPIVREVLRRSKAADIKAWMGQDEDPCENFYNYACGQWRRINSAEATNVYSTDKFQNINQGLQKKVEKLMTQPKTGDVIEDKLRDFYEACKVTKFKQPEYRLALKKLYQAYGQFSFTQKARDAEANQNNFNWWSIVAEIHKTYGKSIILSLDVQSDVKNKQQNMLYIGPTEFYMNQPDMKSIISRFLQDHFGVTEKKAQEVTDTLLEFEWKLMLGATDTSLDKSLEELLTLYETNELIEKYEYMLDFEKFLQLALNTTQLPKQIYLYDESYLENLIDVFASTETSIVQDYILWVLLEEYMIDTRIAAWNKWCGEKAKKYFGKFIDHTIYQKYRSVEYEREVFQLWQEIKATFREALQADEYHWMSNSTRDEAIKKLENMHLSINSYDSENFVEFFQNLPIDPTNYVANIENILKRAESLRLDKLEQKPDGIEEAQVLSFTPVYNSFENSIKMPVALLLPFRIWHPVYPKAIKYATLGFLLAHEMIHGFDDEGRHYDSQAHARNWWDGNSVEEFEERRSCFQAQYHSYIYDGQPLPSSVSQSENIADNAAIKLAFAAYSRWLATDDGIRRDLKTQEGFSNLLYNNWQIFFLSFSQLWCDDVHEKYRTMLVLQDVHAPAEYRVIGSLSNFDKFSEVFKCTAGSFMNPEKKCAVY